ncbi:uncharacterized protein LOC103715595 [Phoenix dactylifera]|uniref:Uncharacterized protein LOC103715595 n=1 Tax=Phoenix dactylifera TaxID=42345 RepID=A0A8B8J8Y9_PHODC|nr:uncharacterized protein LOC103715595 [Phoenix dactylifera]
MTIYDAAFAGVKKKNEMDVVDSCGEQEIQRERANRAVNGLSCSDSAQSPPPSPSALAFALPSLSGAAIVSSKTTSITELSYPRGTRRSSPALAELCWLLERRREIEEQRSELWRELLDPAVKETLNVLRAAKEGGVKRMVVTSSIPAIIPSPSWPADMVKDENCWTDVDYCKQNEIWYPAWKTLAEKAAWEFAKENGLDVVVVNPGTVMGPVIPPSINASMAMPIRLLEDTFHQVKRKRDERKEVFNY